jgi:light-regulated signal transduction histidine kinase (bacteriophytochrome)
LHYNIEEGDKVSKDSVGIGMGLTVCKEIINRISPSGLNYIFVESQLDIGSAFYFFLK